VTFWLSAVAVRAIDNLVGGRAANLKAHATIRRLVDERDIRALTPDDKLFAGARYVFTLRVSATSFVDRKAARISLRQRAGNGARVGASRHAGVPSSSTPRRRPVTDWRKCRPVKTIRRA